MPDMYDDDELVGQHPEVCVAMNQTDKQEVTLQPDCEITSLGNINTGTMRVIGSCRLLCFSQATLAAAVFAGVKCKRSSHVKPEGSG